MKMGECAAAKENENPRGLETDLAERSMWLMKCPSPLVASSLKSLPFPDEPHLPVAKVVMELAGAEFGNVPQRYALDMSKDSIPMSVFCESSSHGEGKIKGTYELKG